MRMRYVRTILDLLTAREKRRGLLVMSMVLVMALLETAGVASVMPFLAVLGNPEIVETNPHLARAYASLGFESPRSFLVALGLLSFLIVVVGSAFRLATHYALYRYANMRRHSIGKRLLASYLRQPYEFFLNRNTADLSKSILSEVDELTRNVFQPGIQLLAYATTVVALVFFLFVVDPWMALGVSGVVGLAYGAIYLGVRGILGRIGRDRLVSNRERFTAAGEVLGGIKDIKVLGREDVYLERFRGPSARYSRHQATNAVLAVVPKYLIEAVGFGGVLGLAVFLLATREDLGAALPLLGAYAFAGYRLLPAAQNVFSSLSKLRFGWKAAEGVHGDLLCLTPERSPTPREVAPGRPEGPRIRVERDIHVDRVSYTYPGADRPSLQDVDVRIPKRSSLGIVGATGAGKTTLADVLLGLLRPSSGHVRVDGRPVDELGERHWQRAVGYVPQNIFLTDGTIAENIALGVPSEAVDPEAVEAAARAAQMHDFVQGLARGYGTPVGERGVRLSGGQRQRIGIARALYHDPQLLVLDEATNALDAHTEALAIDAISGLMGERTLVIIAHRIRTVRDCDRILVLEEGRVAGVGSYGSLERSNPAFRKVALA